MASGRVLSVTATGSDVATAAARSREAAEAIDFEGKQFRRDIGWREIERQVGKAGKWGKLERADLSSFPASMPELPEVETIARDIRPHLEGAVIRTARVFKPDILRSVTRPAFERGLAGRRVIRVGRRAKHLVFELERRGSAW